VQTALEPALEGMARTIAKACHVRLNPHGLDEWREAYVAIQNAEVWSVRRDWIEKVKPDLGAPIRERLEMAARADARRLPEAQKIRVAMHAHLDAMLRDGTVICLPTAPCVAPLRGRGGTHPVRAAIMTLTCIASLGGFPQISLPVGEADGCPVGLSLMSARGSDGMLLALAEKIGQSVRRRGESVNAAAKPRSRARKPKRGSGSRR
jgi:amidase